MAIVPKESIFLYPSVKPATFAVWVLFCQVRDNREPDVYLDLETAARIGIGKTSYYFALDELESNGWIEKTRRFKRRQYWKLLCGFSATPDFQTEREGDFDENSATPDFQKSATPENEGRKSATPDFQGDEKGEISAVPEKKSATPEKHIRNKPTKEPTKEENDSNESFKAITLFQNDPAIREAITGKVGVKKKTDPVTFAEWEQLAAVWFFWLETMHKNANARLSPKRGRAILDRLRGVCGFSVGELNEAIVGCTKSANHNGTKQGGDGTVYDDIELICRDDDQVEKFRGHYEAWKATNGTGNTGGRTDPAGKFSVIGDRDYTEFNDFGTAEGTRPGR